MLDTNILLNLTDEILDKFVARGIEKDYVSELAKTYTTIKKMRQEIESEQAKKNVLVAKFAKLKELKENEISLNQIKNELEKFKENIQNKQVQLSKISDQFDEAWSMIPNLPLDNSIPIGNESNNKIVKVFGEIPTFQFTPLDHWTIAEKQNLVDFKRAAKLAGTRFVIYCGLGARLMRALQAFTIDVNTKNGYKELLPPVLVNRKSFYSSGQFPKFKNEVFAISDWDLFLSSTSEVQLINFYRNEIIPEKDLPIYLTATTINFRSEAGSAGRDIKGLIRLHQFYKTELVKICKAENGITEHEKMVADACEILEKLNLPYRQVLLASKDMSVSSQKTYDLEVWFPGINKYREISSISLCGTYQARRGMIRYNDSTSRKNEYVTTLNGSSLALDRLFAAIIENYQTADGNFLIPQVLEKYI